MKRNHAHPSTLLLKSEIRISCFGAPPFEFQLPLAGHCLCLLRSLLLGCCLTFASFAAETSQAPTATNSLPIDLPTVLRLAGAQNLDVQIARQRLAEAQANRETAIWQFIPAIRPGVSYAQHDHLIQSVEGKMLEVEKNSYTVGPTVAAQVDLGEAIYRALAARQLAKAARFALESQAQNSILDAVEGYFDLVKARAESDIASEAVRIATNYAAQVQQAVGAGLAFKGDVLRVRVQAERYAAALRENERQQESASARLATVLHLDSATALAPLERAPMALELFPTNRAGANLIAEAFRARPELRETEAQLAAARDAKRGATYGPLIPTVGGQLFAGGLGGSSDAGASRFGESEDYQVMLGWKIGPGGLFDRGRVHAAEARFQLSQLGQAKVQDQIRLQVIESEAKLRAIGDRLEHHRRAVELAEETLRLTQARKQFAVGAVLEAIQAEQELTSARLDYANDIAEYNKAQFGLLRAIGGNLAGIAQR